MIDWFRSLFSANPKMTEPSAEEQARIAAVALLYEVGRVDGDMAHDEQQLLLDKLATRWQLTGDSARSLMQAAMHKVHQEVDYHPLVRTLRDQYDAAQRVALVRDMWDIAHADDRIDPHEEHLIRKIADLLYVSHSDFIRTKLQR